MMESRLTSLGEMKWRTLVKKMVKRGDIENVGCYSATLYDSSSYLSRLLNFSTD